MSFYRIILLSIVLSVSVSGCASLKSFKDKIIKASSQQIEPAHKRPSSPSKVNEQKKQQRSHAPSNNCNYIIRDLSVPNASAVWCMPKVQRR